MIPKLIGFDRKATGTVVATFKHHYSKDLTLKYIPGFGSSDYISSDSGICFEKLNFAMQLTLYCVPIYWVVS